MATFPALSSGAALQLPLVKTRVWRVIRTLTPGGYRAVQADGGATKIEWRLRYRGLSPAEAGALRQFYSDARGPLETFAFPDPFANFLASASDLTGPSWQASGLTVTSDGTVPIAGGVPAFRVTNPGAQGSSLSQTIPGSGIAGVCFSVYLRSETERRVLLSAGASSYQAPAGPEWRRFWVRSAGNAANVSLTVPAGSEIWGAAPQAEIQPAPTPFKPSSTGPMVYVKTRFAEGPLRITATGPDSYAADCTLISLLTE